MQVIATYIRPYTYQLSTKLAEKSIRHLNIVACIKTVAISLEKFTWEVFADVATVLFQQYSVHTICRPPISMHIYSTQHTYNVWRYAMKVNNGCATTATLPTLCILLAPTMPAIFIHALREMRIKTRTVDRKTFWFTYSTVRCSSNNNKIIKIIIYCIQRLADISKYMRQTSIYWTKRFVDDAPDHVHRTHKFTSEIHFGKLPTKHFYFHKIDA